MINITIDGKPVSVENDATILDAAQSVGIDIPTLCHHKGIAPCVSCFVCAVKVDGRENFVPSCATAAVDGMVVDTCSEEVMNCRRNALDLLLSTHAGVCEMSCSRDKTESAQCKMNGKAKCFRCACEDKEECKLREYALRYGVIFYSYKNRINIKSKSKIIYDAGKCIVCGKCVNITRARNVKPGLTFSGRGSNVHITAPFGVAFDEAMGDALEECVEACPVGALRKS